MTRIYTRKGDGGTTGLLDGTRVPKDHPRVEACGDLDELGAAIGAARAFAARREVGAALLEIQKDLHEAGAALAGPARRGRGIGRERVAALERRIDRLQARMPPLRGFVLRGGTKGAALLHVACAVCRRAERRIAALSRRAPVPPSVLEYVNRLSDCLFVLARFENGRNREDRAGR